MRPAVVLAAAALGVLLAGCAAAGGGRGAPGVPSPVDTHQAVRVQARDALARWDAAVRAAGGGAVLVPVGDWSGVAEGTWESQDAAGNAKMALLSGAVRAGVALPEAAPAPGSVRWPDGTRATVPLLSPAAALRRMVAATSGNQCGGCNPAPLVVTGARPGTATLATSRGLATVPAWRYTLRGTSVTLVYPAVGPAAVVTVSPPPWNSPPGVSIESATVSADGRTLTAHFVGSKGPASQPCGVDYTATAVESATAVVVIVDERHYTTTSGDEIVCNMIGYPRTATARLAAPLGTRAVLEVRQGLPVAVTRG